MNKQKRVVVTGLGVVSPLGNVLSENWTAVCAGVSGIRNISRFDAKNISSQVAGEVKDLNLDLFIPAKEARKMGLFIKYALVATQEALQNANLKYPFTEESIVNPHRVGVSVASGMGGLPEIEHWDRELFQKTKKVVTPFFVPMIIPNMASGHVSIFSGAKGPNICITTACASSAHAIGESVRTIRQGEVDVMIAGGTEAVVCELGIAGFASMKALSTRNDDPKTASRPYDQDRDGFVLSEGSAVLILEELEFALKRGAPILAEVTGYGATGDAFHITTPAPEGLGAQHCMKKALADGALNPSQIDYVNSHGTSTPAGDLLEASAIAHVFSESKAKLHVSSTKSMTGHLLGAAGAIEAAFSVMAVKNNIVPPTINIFNLDPEAKALGLNFTQDKAVKKEVHHALSNSFGFGGTNASLIFSKFKD